MKTDHFKNVFLQRSTICQGQGVFAVRNIAQNEIVMPLTGPLLTYDQCIQLPPELYDKSLQIGANIYRGPSGDVDYFVNHSCDPNSYVSINDVLTLVTLRPIQRLEEIVFDYSTTMDEDHWEMDCTCGSSRCRGRVRDFKYLPEEIQQQYIALGIAPAYILEGLCQRKQLGLGFR